MKLGISFGQTNIKSEEIKIKYSNGVEIFNICNSSYSTLFDDKKSYYWYNEYSKIKSTKGGCGGSLLHGNYRYYDIDGNLRLEKYFILGLLDGSEKAWDSLGNIVAHHKYKKGDVVYMKFRNDNKQWIEIIGPLFAEGTVRKVYNYYDRLILEETMMPDFKQKSRTFYENSGKLKEEYSSNVFNRDNLGGTYSAYFENGRLEVSGQFYEEKYLNIKTGTWKWYNSEGNVIQTENYKAEILKWPNGEFKIIGELIYRIETNEWLKNGEWYFYGEDGKLESKVKYNWGIELK